VLSGEAEGAITLADLRSRGAADGDAIARERTATVAPGETFTIHVTQQDSDGHVTYILKGAPTPSPSPST